MPSSYCIASLLHFQVTATFQCYEVDNPNPHLMSEEQLKAFLSKVQADKSLQDQLNAEGADVVAIAKAAGFSISTEDLKEHRQDLSDEDLEGVAGGTVTWGGCAMGTLVLNCPKDTHSNQDTRC